MRLTTEQVLMSPDGFGLSEATPVQRAACRARDGLPLRELADHPDVIAAFGGEEAILKLPGEHGHKPSNFFNIASARTAKTTIACAAATTDSQTVDVRGLGHGEVPRISILSVKLDVADVPLERLSATWKESRVLRPLMISEPSGGMFRVRHPSGRPIEIAVTAGGAAGSGLANRWSAGLIADEAPKMSGRDEKVTNLEDALSVVRERLLPGAQAMPIGSPWAPHGPVYDAVQLHFGKPTADIVVMRTTGPAGNPSYWTRERLDRLARVDEVAWRINALGEFLDPESGLFNPASVRRNTRESPLELPPEKGQYSAAVDASEGTATGNPFTLVIVKHEIIPAAAEEAGKRSNVRTKYRVVLARQWRGATPEVIWRDIGAICRRYGVTSIVGDQYAGSANTALARHEGVTLTIEPWTAQLKLDSFTSLATLVHTDCVELAPDRLLRSDLLSVKKRATQSGYSIILPKGADGRHADYAPALAAAVRSGAAGRLTVGRALVDSLNGIFHEPTNKMARAMLGLSTSEVAEPSDEENRLSIIQRIAGGGRTR